MAGNGSSPFDSEKIRRMRILLVNEIYLAGSLLALARNAVFTSSNLDGVYNMFTFFCYLYSLSDKWDPADATQATILIIRSAS